MMGTKSKPQKKMKKSKEKEGLNNNGKHKSKKQSMIKEAPAVSSIEEQSGDDDVESTTPVSVIHEKHQEPDDQEAMGSLLKPVSGGLSDDEEDGLEFDAGEISSGDEEMDASAHRTLLANIQSLDAKKKPAQKQIRGLAFASSNPDLVIHAQTESSKVQAGDIKMRDGGKKTELTRPLTDGELEVAKRQIARESMGKEMKKWDPVVRDIRLAPQTIYTAQPLHGRALVQALKPKQFVPRTPLERELYTALGRSADLLRPNAELTPAEERALKAMSLKEARARREELMKHHELLSRMEVKAKRLKKIKSKKYRRILRREREAKDKKELEQLQKSDPEAFLERMEEMERDRMEERLTLKHRGGGKFSRLHKAYSKFDDKTREAMQEMLQKSKELTRRTQDTSESEDEEVTYKTTLDGEEAGADEDKAPAHATLNAPESAALQSVRQKAGGWLDAQTKFVYADEDKKSEAAACDKTKESSQGEDDSNKDDNADHPDTADSADISLLDEEEGEAVTQPHVATENASVEPIYEKDSSIEITEKQKKKKKGKKRKVEDSVNVTEACVPDSESGKDISTDAVEEPKAKKKRKNKKKKKEGESEESKTDAKLKPVKETVLIDVDKSDDADDGENSEEEGDLKVSMEELFKDEDFMVEEFAKEKAEMEEKARPSVEDVRLPGWGSWAGPDYKEAEKKKAEKKKRQQPKKKPDKQHYLWLNPNRDEHLRKFQPKSVPFPYASVQQYEASLRQPVSRGFVTETAQRLLVKPPVVTKQGHIIKPISKDDYFSDKAEVTGDDTDKNFGSGQRLTKLEAPRGKLKQNKRRGLK